MICGADKKLCHNCDTKPVLAVKTDVIDRVSLLILRNLLKTQMCLKIPEYRFAINYFVFIAIFAWCPVTVSKSCQKSSPDLRRFP